MEKQIALPIDLARAIHHAHIFYSLKALTHTDDVISTSADLFSFFSCPKNSSINHLNFYCIKQISRYHFSMHVYCNRSQKIATSCKEQQSRHLNSSHVVYTFCSLHTVTSSVIYYRYSTHAQKM